MSAINRDKAIEVIEDELDKIDHVPQWVFDRLTNRLRELPPTEPHWIPCSEKLPKESGTYLITAKRLRVTTKFFSAEGDGWGKGCWNEMVTAWMPMLKCYEESEVETWSKN